MKCLFLACLCPAHCHILTASQTLVVLGHLHPAPSHTVILSQLRKKEPPKSQSIKMCLISTALQELWQTQPVGGKCGQVQNFLLPISISKLFKFCLLQGNTSCQFYLTLFFQVNRKAQGVLKEHGQKVYVTMAWCKQNCSSLNQVKSPPGSWG